MARDLIFSHIRFQLNQGKILDECQCWFCHLYDGMSEGIFYLARMESFRGWDYGHDNCI
jgi:hypothetical protein